MNFIKKVSRSIKRVVLGSDSDSDARDDDGRGARAGRRRGRSRATPVVESAVSELSGLAHGGVQGLNWVAAGAARGRGRGRRGWVFDVRGGAGARRRGERDAVEEKEARRTEVSSSSSGGKS